MINVGCQQKVFKNLRQISTKNVNIFEPYMFKHLEAIWTKIDQIFEKMFKRLDWTSTTLDRMFETNIDKKGSNV